MSNKQCFYLTLVVCLMDCLFPFVLALFYPGYNHLTLVVSSLGNKNSPVKWFFDIWMILLGVSFISIGIHLFQHLKEGSNWIRILFLLITLVYAVFDCIVSGFFAAGESSKMETIPQMIHGYGSSIGCTLLVFAGLVGAIIIRKAHPGIAKFLVIDFICAFLSFAIFISCDKFKEMNGVAKIFTYEGLWQRISFVFMYIPYVVLTRLE